MTVRPIRILGQPGDEVLRTQASAVTVIDGFVGIGLPEKEQLAKKMRAACGSGEYDWALASGRGRIYSWTITHRPIDPGFADELPYAVLVVEMEEGPRLVGNLRDLAPSELSLGLPVEVVFEPVADRVALTHFRPVP